MVIVFFFTSLLFCLGEWSDLFQLSSISCEHSSHVSPLFSKIMLSLKSCFHFLGILLVLESCFFCHFLIRRSSAWGVMVILHRSSKQYV